MDTTKAPGEAAFLLVFGRGLLFGRKTVRPEIEAFKPMQDLVPLHIAKDVFNAAYTVQPLVTTDQMYRLAGGSESKTATAVFEKYTALLNKAEVKKLPNAPKQDSIKSRKRQKRQEWEAKAHHGRLKFSDRVKFDFEDEYFEPGGESA
jgi:hypothetical protein